MSENERYEKQKVILMDNKKKKEYLCQYRNHVRKIIRIEAELSEIRLMKISSSCLNDGMPHGSNQSDLSGYASHLDELERDLLRERYKRIKSYTDITERIRKVENENESDVLFYRYIKGLDWWEIAEKMRYCERQVHRYHGKALMHIEIPDVIECQYQS